jgi:hypothetical protein
VGIEVAYGGYGAVDAICFGWLAGFACNVFPCLVLVIHLTPILYWIDFNTSIKYKFDVDSLQKCRIELSIL